MRVSPARFRWSLLSVLGAPWLLSACPLDDRTLSSNVGAAGTHGQAGASSLSAGGDGGALPAGGTDAGGTDAGGGAAGQAGEAGTSVTTFSDGCSDLDADGVSDCTETLLDNSAFRADVLHWTAQANASLTWNAHDLLGSPASGSARVTSTDILDAAGNGLTAAEQCVLVSEGQQVDIVAQAYIEPGQAAGSAGIGLWFFATAGCSGDSPAESYEATEQFDTSRLLMLRGSKSVPAQIVSMRVRLSVIKPFRAAPFSVRFDNVLVRAR